MFLSFFHFSSKVLFSHSFSFILSSSGTAKSMILHILFFFLLIIIRSGLLAGIRWSVCMSKSHRSLCVSFCRTVAGLCIYHLLVWSSLNFLPTQSCLVLYSFYANLLHSLIMWLIVIIIISIIIIIYSFRVFHISISWWNFTGI